MCASENKNMFWNCAIFCEYPPWVYYVTPTLKIYLAFVYFKIGIYYSIISPSLG